MEKEEHSVTEKGGISVEIEHIFPIIKKWLYSEKEIFLREIVSNACDAVTKLRRLISLGEADIDDNEPWEIEVILDKDAGTITVTDNGIGMTEDEVKKYICQIALSGALEFVKKYENSDSTDSQSAGIIGHFGLGFYSAFMVSSSVDVITRSYTGEPAVKWSCSDTGEYEIEQNYDDPDSLIDSHGTAVVMHISEEGKEFLSEYKLREILDKYCAFMPVNIFLTDVSKDNETTDNGEDGEKEPKPVNDTNPLWQKNPSDCTEEEYKAFYHKVFKDYKEPLFHIHIKADYPLNFKGILYFPRITNEYESLEGQVKLYYNQVFVADNIKEVIPEYLLMLKGVLDCPELPLNVSRSYLQNSGYVSKISAHITKKVADKLTSMFTTDRENYEKIWRDIKTFVEYACLRDRKFYDRVKDAVLFEKVDGKYCTVGEYLDAAKNTHEKKFYYTTDKVSQAKYISMFEEQNVEIVVLDKVLDTQFISVIESTNDGVKFVRVDAELGALSDGEGEKNDAVEALFKKIAGEKTTVKFERLKDAGVPALLNLSEEGRRMEDMMKMYSMNGGAAFPVETTLILNSDNKLISKLSSLSDTDSDLAEKLAKQIYSLSLLGLRPLNGEELKQFLSDSYDILGQL